MIKYVVLGVTNGEGHSDPTVIVGTDKHKMYAEFEKLCNELASYHDMRLNYTNHKSKSTSKIYSDSTDNFGAHIFELPFDKAHVIEIEACYADEIKIHEGDLNEMKQYINEHIHDEDFPVILELIPPTFNFQKNNEYSFMQIKEFADEREMELREIGPDVIGESIIIVKPDEMSVITFVMTGYNANGAIYECVYCDYNE